jgi:aspartyl/asparaginyl-tRNA synthetase
LFSDNKKIDGVQINDLVKNNRNNNLIGFLEFNNESCFRNIQVVYKSEINIFDI